MIEISQLRVKKNNRTICSVLELKIVPGERVAILGPNGSGKTTLLRVLSGLETNYDGRLSVNASQNNRTYVHQSPYLFRGTVLFNVTYGLRQRGTSRSDRKRLALQWLRRLGVDKLSRSCAAHLSGGEKRRVALARAMILRPRLLLLDEPLADMDTQGADAVLAALDELKDCTMLITSPTKPLPGLTTRDYSLASVASY